MSKKLQFTQLGGKTKSGKPIVKKYKVDIGQTKDSHSIQNLKTIIIVVVVILLIIALIYGQIEGYVVWFNRSAINSNTIFAIDLNFVEIELEHYLWSLINALLIGVYISALVPLSGKKDYRITIILIIVIIVIAILSLGYLGIFLFIDLPIFCVKTFISNQIEGTEFFIANIAFFLIIYASSFLIEAET